MNTMFDKNAPQNVHGWERTASVAGGLMLLGRGLWRGGFGGFLQAGIGAMALARGMTGRCEAKRILEEQMGHSATSTAPAAPMPDQRYSHMPMDSEVHSPDFEGSDVTLPDTTPMGAERQPGGVSPLGPRP